MSNRRDFLRSGIAAAGVSLTAGACAAPAAKIDIPASNTLAAAGAMLRGGPLFRRDRAYQVMAEENLDGLIVCQPLNVFHFSGYHDHWTLRIDEPSSFVLFSRNESTPPALVMNQFLYYYSFADSDFEWPGDVFLFTGWDPGTDVDADAPLDTPPAFVFGNREERPLRLRERRRLEDLDAILAGRAASPGAVRALQAAVRHTGLDGGRIGSDDTMLAALFEHAQFSACIVDGTHALRRIRLIKSAREIALMRAAATANAAAALAAVRSVRAGASHRELRSEFFSQCARRGNHPGFLQIDSVMSEIYDQQFAEGDAFAIDAVSTGLHYTGDFGRTVFVGEPARSMRRACEAISIGWEAVREKLRPGLRYSEIREIGREAIRKAGYPYLAAVTPHSVGLCHTDEPGQVGRGPYWLKDDLVLEKDMIISVDMPILHSGIGGTAHLEDLTLITADGSEAIHPTGDEIVIV